MGEDSPLRQPKNVLEQLSEPKQQLAKIITTPLTPENINSYFDNALDATVALTTRAVALYTNEHSPVSTLKSEIEDEAFAYFGLDSIPQILTLVAEKQQDIADVDAYIRDHLKHTPMVFVPTNGQGPNVGSGAGTYEKPTIKNRLKTLLYILKNSGVPLNGVALSRGDLRHDMVRKESYIGVLIPVLDRFVLVCDEHENASYVFDTKKLQSVSVNSSDLVNLSKEELNGLIREHPILGTRFVYSKDWSATVRRLLEEISNAAPEKRVPVDLTIPQVSTSELDPNKGFYVAEDGKHYGSMAVIMSKLGLSVEIHKEKIWASSFATRTVRDGIGKARNMYAFEDVQGYFKDFLSIPRVALEGKDKGFYKKDGHVYAVPATLSDSLGLDRSVIDRRIKKASISSIKVRDVANREGDAYDIEVVKSLFGDFLAMPRVVLEGEWTGFVEHQGQHFGTIGSITTKLKPSRTLGYYLKKNPGPTLAIRGFQGQERTGFSFEHVQNIIKTLDPIQQVATEGAWKGFITKDGKHFGAIYTIAQRLNMSSMTVQRKIQETLCPSTSIEDLVGKKVIGYSLEFLEAEFSETLSFPMVSREGEWKGFAKQEGKHYGSILKISEKLGVDRGALQNHVSKYSLKGIQVRVENGRTRKAYAYEDVQDSYRTSH